MAEAVIVLDTAFVVDKHQPPPFPAVSSSISGDVSTRDS